MAVDIKANNNNNNGAAEDVSVVAAAKAMGQSASMWERVYAKGDMSGKGRSLGGLVRKLHRKKQLGPDIMETPLKRCLTTFDITVLGIGHMVGAGIYVLTGTVAKDKAGPGIMISFLLAGIASLLSAFCYSEFGARVPKAGSVFTYAYVTVGEFWAFLIGWDIVLEHLIAAASVAKAFSGTVDALTGNAISTTMIDTFGRLDHATGSDFLAPSLDLVAFAVVLIYSAVLAVGVKASAWFNTTFTMLNMAVMCFVIVFGFIYADPVNWSDKYGGFLPYGFSGVMAGAANVFYAFVGFDTIAVTSEEARNPSFAIPVATLLSLGIVTVGYILFGAALTLIVPYSQINAAAAMPQAFAAKGVNWAKWVVTVGSLAGMSTTMTGSLFSLPRILYAMSTDGLLFKFLSRVNKQTQLPLITMVISSLFCASVALLFNLEKLVEFMSIGTLMAYTLVSSCILLLRYRYMPPPHAPTEAPTLSSPQMECGPIPIGNDEETDRTGRLKPAFSGGFLSMLLDRYPPGRIVSISVVLYIVFAAGTMFMLKFGWGELAIGLWWLWGLLVILVVGMILFIAIMCAYEQNTRGLAFKAPGVPFIPALSIVCNIGLMTYLDALTWIRFAAWLIIGLLIYFCYGIWHSKEEEQFGSQDLLLKTSASAETLESKQQNWGAIDTTTKKESEATK